MNKIQQRIELVESALGRRSLDLIIHNIKVVNVYTGEIESGSIGIKNGRIVSTQVGNRSDTIESFSGRGLYAMPGFIDTHIHIDSTLLTPESLAELIVPHGTTALFADPMEIANVAGRRGLEALLQSSSSLPLHLLIEVSSRVPTAPGLETTGGELGLAEVRVLLQREDCISLGELDPSKILGLREEYFAKIDAAHALGKIANGHAAGLHSDELVAYANAGLADDHECVSYEEAKERISLGLSILVREGSTERNLKPLLRGLISNGADTRHWMMCTDDKHPNDILSEGHIDYMINLAISLGIPSVQAIQMATLNAAIHFRLEHQLGSLTPGRWADIVLAKSLNIIKPSYVFFKGQLVAKNGQMTTSIPRAAYPDWLNKTVNITRGAKSSDFDLPCDGNEAVIHVIKITPEQIINFSDQAILHVTQGSLVPDPDQDVLKLAVVERYGKNGNIGISFVRGFGLKRGAISSSVAHDHHNIIIAGADEASMATCVRATQDMQGGLVVALAEEVLARLPLPLAGLMSEEPPSEVIENLERLNAAARSLGCALPAPFMSLSFISLPTVPEFGITDKGLVRVRDHKLINPFLNSIL